MTVAYLGLGANLGDARQTLKDAVVCLAQQRTITVLAKSSLYRTAPIDAGGDDYFNCVVKIETSLPARHLLRALPQGRASVRARAAVSQCAAHARSRHPALRRFHRIDEADLIVPHPRLTERAFALVPLVELDGDADHSATRPRRCVPRRACSDQRIEKVQRPASVRCSRRNASESSAPSAASNRAAADERRSAPHRHRAAIAPAASLSRDRRADRRRQDVARHAARRTLVDAHAVRAAAGQSVSRTLLSRHHALRVAHAIDFALQRAQQTQEVADAHVGAARRSSPIS